MGRKSKLKSQKYILCEEKYFLMLKWKYRRNLIKIKCIDCGKILTEVAKFKREHFSDEIYVAFDVDEMNKEDTEWCKRYARTTK